MQVNEFTLSQVLRSYSGHFEKENNRIKAIQIVTWEATRWKAFIDWNLHVTKKGRLHDPKKLIKFEWDKKEEKIDPEEMNKIFNLFPDKPRHGNE